MSSGDALGSSETAVIGGTFYLPFYVAVLTALKLDAGCGGKELRYLQAADIGLSVEGRFEEGWNPEIRPGHPGFHDIE